MKCPGLRELARAGGSCKPPRQRTSTLVAVATAATFLAACTDDVRVLRASTVVVDSAGVEVVTSDPWGSEAHCTLGNEPTLSIGAAEGDAPHMFFQVRAAARLSDGSVAVVDGSSREIRLFGETGEHLRSMGGPGEGPGEFRGPWLLWVLPGDTLWVGDYLPWRFNIFSADGVFSRSLTPDDFSLHALTPPGGVLDDGTSVNVTPTPAAPVARAGTPATKLGSATSVRWPNFFQPLRSS